MPAKTKTNYSEKSEGGSIKDSFFTPRYATEIILDFIPKHIKNIWECAAGDGRMMRPLLDAGYNVCGTTLAPTPIGEELGIEAWDFLSGGFAEVVKKWMLNSETFAIITNPPFSLKLEFYRQCLKYNIPFALLIPLDWSGWMIDAFRNDGTQMIIPERRIDFITPNILKNIPRKELWRNRKDLFTSYKKFSDIKENEFYWNYLVETFGREWVYERVDDVPQELLAKHSSSDFHSGWLVNGFDLPEQLTFVDLSISDKKRVL